MGLCSFLVCHGKSNLFTLLSLSLFLQILHLSLVTNSSKLSSNSFWIRSGAVGIKFRPLLKRNFSACSNGTLERFPIAYNRVMTLTYITVMHIILVIYTSATNQIAILVPRQPRTSTATNQIAILVPRQPSQQEQYGSYHCLLTSLGDSQNGYNS